ncbi:hypothetical protein A2U01_0109166, partial [Trifolium medium]|nr:hypothetical protein [Trifolium medium]
PPVEAKGLKDVDPRAYAVSFLTDGTTDRTWIRDDLAGGAPLPFR